MANITQLPLQEGETAVAAMHVPGDLVHILVVTSRGRLFQLFENDERSPGEKPADFEVSLVVMEDEP